MEIVEVNTNIYPNLGPHISAADECSVAIVSLGLDCGFSIKGQKGSHGAEIWVSDDKKELFETNVLPNIVKGTYHTFFFIKCTPYGGEYSHYYVSYRKN